MSSHSGGIPDLTSSCLIVGDNLEVLPSLSKKYPGRFKCIYLDPPYNDGSQVFYDLTSDSETWLQEIGIRLRLLRECLHSEGALAISISDYEFPRLRLLAEDIFGRDNFVATLIWLTKRGAQGIPRKTMVMPNHEYILVLAKDLNRFSFRGKSRPKEQFSNPDSDPRGPWKRQYLQRLGKNFFPKTLVNPKNGMSFTFETPYTLEKLQRWVDEGKIVFPNNPRQYPMKKEFLSEYSHLQQLTTFLGLYPTKSNTEALNRLFGGVKIFPYAKPTRLLMDLFEWISQPDDWILDPYAGSGTTAEAILRLPDQGRKYVLIQKKEPIPSSLPAYQAGYRFVDEIIRERVLRVEGEIGLRSTMATYVWHSPSSHG